ncbi:hypothetical protein ACLMJK_007103 [Lecanora helva]
MEQKQSITISNRSGAVQNYVLFAEAPQIKPSSGSQLKTNIIVAFRGVAGNGGQAYFTMPKERLFAICGTSNSDGLKDLVQIEVLDKMPVTIGAQTRDGTLLAGTACDMVVKGGTPIFSDQQTAPALGELGGFCIRTKRDFSYQESKEGRYVLGLGISTSLIREIGPYVVFTPSPNQLYQIKPSNTFYVVASDEDTRAPVTPELKERACKIDFNLLRTNDVLLLHNDRGELTIQLKAQL